MQYRIAGGQFRVPADLPDVGDHPVEGRERFYNGFVIRVLKAVLRAQGITVTVVGAENIPATGGALLAMNHTGYYDFIFGEVPGHVRGRRLVRFMAKKEVFDTPVVGTVMKTMDHVSVDRDNGASSVEEAIERLHSGQIVGIFPEATISRSFELKEFKTGAARIAAGDDVPLIPMVTWGSQRIWTKGRKKNLGRSHVPVFIHVGAPVDTSGTAEEATARLKSAMSDLLDDARSAYDAEYGPFEDGLHWRPVSMGGSAPTLAEADAMDAEYRADKRARRQAKAREQQEREARREAARKQAAKTVEKLDRRADAALGNARGLWDRIVHWWRK